MALITDPDQLNQATEVVFNTTAKTIQLLVAGNLSNDGVTLKAVYSFAKEEWKDDAALIAFEFPFTPITDEFFELQEGWNWADATTRNLLRRGGFLVRNTSGNVTEHWAGIAILGAQADDQVYYDNGNGATDFVFTGNTAEVVQVISDPNGDGNYADGFNRSANITAYNREQGQLFSSSSTSANGESSLLAPKLFSLTVGTGTDLKISESDANIASQAPYTGMSITYNSTPQSRAIGASNFDFGIIIDGNSGTAEQIYEFIQYQLRQAGDIDAGSATVLGRTADALLAFVGDNLETRTATNPEGGGTGVFIDNFQAADTNRISFTDNTGTARTFPFVAVTTISFNANLQNDADAIYRVYFTDANGNQYGSAAAILVDDNGGSDVAGNISGSATVQFDFDYDGNVQGGRTAGTDAAITVVAIGLQTGQYVRATGIIGRSTSNSVSLVAPTERNYENAA
ncbi:MAG: hypothetical protein AAGK66_06075 [Pseudomonadota bacterium]